MPPPPALTHRCKQARAVLLHCYQCRNARCPICCHAALHPNDAQALRRLAHKFAAGALLCFWLAIVAMLVRFPPGCHGPSQDGAKRHPPTQSSAPFACPSPCVLVASLAAAGSRILQKWPHMLNRPPIQQARAVPQPIATPASPPAAVAGRPSLTAAPPRPGLTAAQHSRAVHLLRSATVAVAHVGACQVCGPGIWWQRECRWCRHGG